MDSSSSLPLSTCLLHQLLLTYSIHSSLILLSTIISHLVRHHPAFRPVANHWSLAPIDDKILALPTTQDTPTLHCHFPFFQLSWLAGAYGIKNTLLSPPNIFRKRKSEIILSISALSFNQMLLPNEKQHPISITTLSSLKSKYCPTPLTFPPKICLCTFYSYI